MNCVFTRKSTPIERAFDEYTICRSCWLSFVIVSIQYYYFHCQFLLFTFCTIKSTPIQRAFDWYTIFLYFKIIISVFFTTKISTFERAFDDDDDITCRIYLLLLLSLAFYYKNKHHRKGFRLICNLSWLFLFAFLLH